MTQKTKKLWQLVIILAVNLALLIIVSLSVADAVCLGGSGERVAEIQRKIKNQGFYNGGINGVFDFETRHGIEDFQTSNGIKATGEADYKTVILLGIDSCESPCFCSRVELLARCIAQSGCRNYPEMLSTGERILSETDGAVTLGRYISQYYPDFLKNSDEPSSEIYSAAINAIRSMQG